jgi:hypothetical protein
VLNTFRQIGISLVSAIIGAILISTILLRLNAGIAQSVAIPPPSKQAISRLLVQQSSGLAFGESGIFNSQPPPVRDEMMRMRREATTAAIQRAFWFGAAFALLGLAVSTLLPLRPNEHSE